MDALFRAGAISYHLAGRLRVALATTDYLYLGGDGFKLNEADKAPTQTRVSIQTALIEWTKGKKSDQKKPLETQLPK